MKKSFIVLSLIFSVLAIAQEENYILLIDHQGINETFFDELELVSIRTKEFVIKGEITKIISDTIFVNSIAICACDIQKISMLIQKKEANYRGYTNVLSGGILLTSGILLQNSNLQREQIISAVSIIAGVALLTKGFYSFFDRKIFKSKNGYHFKTAVLNRDKST